MDTIIKIHEHVARLIYRTQNYSSKYMNMLQDESTQNYSSKYMNMLQDEYTQNY